MKLKRFEAFLGYKWVAWVENDNVQLSLTGRVAKVVSKDAEGAEYVTHLNLDVVPAYTIAKA